MSAAGSSVVNNYRLVGVVPGETGDVGVVIRNAAEADAAEGMVLAWVSL